MINSTKLQFRHSNGIFHRSPQYYTNCGPKRKAPDRSSVDNEGHHGDILHNNSLLSTYLDSPPMSWEPSTWRGDTSEVGTIRFLGRPEYSYKNVHLRRSLETIRGNLSTLDDYHFFFLLPLSPVEVLELLSILKERSHILYRQKQGGVWTSRTKLLRWHKGLGQQGMVTLHFLEMSLVIQIFPVTVATLAQVNEGANALPFLET